MKILVFYPYIPWPLDCGTFQRTFHLLRELARVHQVHLFALAENGAGLEHKAVFDAFCDRVEFFPFQHPDWQKLFPDRLLNPLPSHVAHWLIPGVAERLDALLASEKYEVVHACDIILAPYFMPQTRSATSPISQRPREQTPLIIDRSRVDLLYQWAEHSRMNYSFSEKLLRYESYAKLWLFERAVAKRATLQIVCGEDDKNFLHRVVSSRANVETLVNGVDLDYFDPAASSEPRAARPTVLFCGVMDYNPNVDALRWYFSEIHEPLRKLIPDLEVLVVGKNPTAEVKGYSHFSKVTVTGGVPDVRPYYRRAWLQIVPLRIGGGSRLKIVESLAIGTPVVSTTIGAQGLGLTHDHDILLADTATNFARQTARVLADASLRKSMAIAGLETAQARLSWPKLGQQLNEIYATHLLGTEDRPAQPLGHGEELPTEADEPRLLPTKTTLYLTKAISKIE